MSVEIDADKRVRRTKTALLEAFKNLVLTTPYENITVNDIIADADIGRSTFYKHYTGKDDILASSLKGPMDTIAQSILPESSPNNLESLLAHFWDQRRFARIILSGSSRKHVTEVLIESLKRRLTQHFKQSSSQCSVPIPMASEMIAEAQLTLMLAWLLGRGGVTAKEMSKTMGKISRSFPSAFSR